jgi:hypothetical protein
MRWRSRGSAGTWTACRWRSSSRRPRRGCCRCSARRRARPPLRTAGRPPPRGLAPTHARGLDQLVLRPASPRGAGRAGQALGVPGGVRPGGSNRRDRARRRGGRPCGPAPADRAGRQVAGVGPARAARAATGCWSRSATTPRTAWRNAANVLRHVMPTSTTWYAVSAGDLRAVVGAASRAARDRGTARGTRGRPHRSGPRAGVRADRRCRRPALVVVRHPPGQRHLPRTPVRPAEAARRGPRPSPAHDRASMVIAFLASGGRPVEADELSDATLAAARELDDDLVLLAALLATCHARTWTGRGGLDLPREAWALALDHRDDLGRGHHRRRRALRGRLALPPRSGDGRARCAAGGGRRGPAGRRLAPGGHGRHLRGRRGVPAAPAARGGAKLVEETRALVPEHAPRLRSLVCSLPATIVALFTGHSTRRGGPAPKALRWLARSAAARTPSTPPAERSVAARG